MVLKVRRSVDPPSGCPVSDCMKLLDGLWTPHVIWSLSEGARRFSEISRDLRIVSAKTLSSRLKDLETRGVLTRTVTPTRPPTVEYALTDVGQELIPVIRAIVDVGSNLYRLRLTVPASTKPAEAGLL